MNKNQEKNKRETVANVYRYITKKYIVYTSEYELHASQKPRSWWIPIYVSGLIHLH
jgi:hypothetical protein